MPKMKTLSSAKKRYKITGTGEVKRKKAYRRHILTSKSRKRKRQLRQNSLVHPTNMGLVSKQLLLG
jgi:large subunit ribosomal protein L35